MAKITMLVPVLLLALYVNEGESVRCWTCSSDLHPNCNDPFIGGHSESPYLYRLENCDANTGVSYPYLATSKSVCKKQKKYVNGQLIVSRGCTWKRSDDYSNYCPNGNNEPAYFCETCEYDGCNSASALGKAIALVLAPFALLLFK